jgi:hypothetical protein
LMSKATFTMMTVDDRQIFHWSKANLRHVIRMANLNNDKERDRINDAICKYIGSFRYIGTRDKRAFRITHGNKLIAELPMPRSLIDVRGVTKPYADRRNPYLQHAGFKPFLFLDIGILEYADTKSGSPSFGELEKEDWYPTGFNVVMRIDTSRRGAANGIYIIWNSYPTMGDGKRSDQRLYCDDNGQGYSRSGIYLEDRGKTKSVSVARIADHITDLSRCHPFDLTEVYTRRVDIRYTEKESDGTIGIYTGQDCSLPEHYSLIFSETDSL